MARALKLAIYVVPDIYWIEKMTSADQGNYSIKVQDNILHVDINGVFNDDLATSYDQDMRNLVQEMQGRPWGSLAIYHGNSIFTPEAEQALIEITKYRVQYGMVANATVILNSAHADLQQMQLRRIYQASNITFHVFSDEKSAKNWLKEFLQQQNVAM